MIPESLYDVINYGVRVLLVTAVPICFILAAAGTLAGVFQGATNIREKSLNYFFKIIALAVLAYLALPGLIQYLINLAELAWKP